MCHRMPWRDLIVSMITSLDGQDCAMRISILALKKGTGMGLLATCSHADSKEILSSLVQKSG